MFKANAVILYVNDLHQSIDYYSQLLDKEPAEKSPTFASMILNDNVFLGLKSRHAVDPQIDNEIAGAGELAFEVETHAEVDTIFQRWKSLQVNMIQEPKMTSFAYTFVAVDLDGHRLRVFFPIKNFK